jgi:sec1 family domain-containing protein 1
MRVTRLVEALMDPTSASTPVLQETDDYLLLDPRARQEDGGRGRRLGYGEGTVFVVGGGGYVEYGNLAEWAAKHGKRVTYGTTDIHAPTEFVTVLASLAD